MILPRNPGHHCRGSFGLDTWVLMDEALRLGKRPVYDWSFKLDKGSASLCRANRRSPGAGAIRLSLNWPTKEQNPPTGVVAVSHPDWDTLPRIVLLAGIPNIDGEFVWRFLCPIARRLVQVVYFDKESQLFVSPAAMGRRQRRSDVRRLERHFIRLLQLQHKYGDLQEKPAGMSDLVFRALKEAAEWLDIHIRLAAGGVPEPIFNDAGWLDVAAMSKRAFPKADVKGRMYYRDKSGALKMNARSKKRLGLS